jgi:hypothetical protein
MFFSVLFFGMTEKSSSLSIMNVLRRQKETLLWAIHGKNISVDNYPYNTVFTSKPSGALKSNKKPGNSPKWALFDANINVVNAQNRGDHIQTLFMMTRGRTGMYRVVPPNKIERNNAISFYKHIPTSDLHDGVDNCTIIFTNRSRNQ